MKDAAFSSARLLALYDRISDADDAIRNLRRFVLDLAVRGKLVEQDASDEPASELLKRIAQEKARLVKSKEIRKSEVESVTQDEEPHLLPINWAWTRLGSIGDWGAGSTPSRGNSELYGGSMTWLKSGELNDNTALAGSEETVTEIAVKKGSFRVNKPGDVLIAMYGATIGKLAILAETAVTNQAVCGCTPFDGVANRFLFLFLLAYRAKFHAASEGGAQPNISKVKIVGTPFSLPPLAEQHRIVAKVDELMVLCDQLEQARAGREAVRDRLTTASLARLTAPETDAEAFQSHARFALQSLPTLTTRPEQIKTLRQTILNLAVRGKLAAQDAADEPAAELLKRIGAAHPKRKNLKKHEFGVPNQLADGWNVAHLDAIASFENGDRSSNYPSGSDIKSEGNAFFSTKNLMDNRLHFSNLDFITNEKFASLRSGKLVDQDILITLRGSVGKFGIFEATPSISTGFINAQLMIIRCVDRAIVPYLLRFMQSGIFSEQITRLSSGSATPQLSAGKLGEAELWLPPLAEQHRIVAKVDALMALCDQLEASLTTTATTRSKLLNALLHEALEPAADELEAAE